MGYAKKIVLGRKKINLKVCLFNNPEEHEMYIHQIARINSDYETKVC
jgi:hypothetical protein